MRTLYVRIIVVTMAIMIASGVIAFIASNVLYHFYLKPVNDEKVTNITKNVIDVFERNHEQPIRPYLKEMTDLGYQFYLVSPDGTESAFGESFRLKNIDDADVEDVLEGNIYHGIRDYPQKIFITGFFSNELKNTIGAPVEVEGENHALFVRPDTQKQFGEMRIFLAILLILILLLSFALVLLSTRFIVKPIKKLTAATRKISGGNYHLKLRTNRRDEIGELAHDFQQMSDGLRQTEEKRQEFVSNVSHEIQSPLTSIQGFSKALREEGMTAEEKRYYLSIIENEAARLSGLSKQLLTLSFLDKEMESIEKVPFDVSEQIKEVVQSTTWLWREKDLALEMNLFPVQIEGDSGLLRQVWMNLFTNAVNYTETGGSVIISMAKRQDVIDIFFRDTGVGIAESEIPELFERFYKADKARKRTESSTGLGLAIVKKIVELHDGIITVESKQGEGSTFCVTLPADRS